MKVGRHRRNPESRNRRSIRLAAHDYGQPGAYFITVVTHGRECFFGRVLDCEMKLNRTGRMVAEVWRALPNRFTNLAVDDFVIMPNHIHGIVDIENVGAPLVGARQTAPTSPEEEDGATTRVAPTLGAVVGAFKSLTAVQYVKGVRENGWPPFQDRLWQRNYYEHIIRNAESRQSIVEYLAANPINWANDPENPIGLD